jgi:hypothetical protein
MQFDVVDLLILSVGRVEDDKKIVKLEMSIRNASRRQLTFGSSSTACRISGSKSKPRGDLERPRSRLTFTKVNLATGKFLHVQTPVSVFLH